jgi:hypothetical protein
VLQVGENFAIYRFSSKKKGVMVIRFQFDHVLDGTWYTDQQQQQPVYIVGSAMYITPGANGHLQPQPGHSIALRNITGSSFELDAGIHGGKAHYTDSVITWKDGTTFSRGAACSQTGIIIQSSHKCDLIKDWLLSFDESSLEGKFAEWDLNADGKLSFSEFRQATHLDYQSARSCFDVCDVSNDGFLELQELRDYAGALHQLAQEIEAAPVEHREAVGGARPQFRRTIGTFISLCLDLILWCCLFSGYIFDLQ